MRAVVWHGQIGMRGRESRHQTGSDSRDLHHRIRSGGPLLRQVVRLQSYLLLVSSLVVNTAMAVGCANGFVDRASTSPAETYQHLGDQAVLYRQEAVDLRAAARYYEGEAQRSAEEAGQDSERARRYRDFAQQASVQAIEADRHAE